MQKINESIKAAFDLTNIKLKAPIFIVGSPRAGTTYLRKILEKHPDILTFPGETHILTNFNVTLNEYLKKFEAENDFDKLIMSVISAFNYGNDCAAIFADRKRYPLDVKLEYEDLKKLNYIEVKNRYDAFNSYVTYTAARENKTRWVEKTQSNIHNISEIIKRFPNALFIEIYRDPRAVYYSWLHAKQLYFRQSTVFDFIHRWKSAINDGLKYSKQFSSQCYKIKYENLIENPEHEIKELCKFLSEEPVKEMFNSKPDDFGFDNTTKTDAWVKCLQNYEKLYIDLLTKKERKILGYKDSGARLILSNSIQLFIFSTRSLIQSKIYLEFTNKHMYILKRIYNETKTTIKKSFLALFSDRRKIFSYLKSAQEKNLLISSKNTSLTGWLCSNINLASNETIYLDLKKRFPFEDNIFDHILIDNAIEYQTYNQSKNAMNECFRILKPEGKIRISTVSLENIMKLYLKKEQTKEEKDFIRLLINSCMPDIGIYKNAFVVNTLFNRLNYKFIFDHESLSELLEKSRFSNVKLLDNFDSKIEMNKFINLTIEARRP